MDDIASKAMKNNAQYLSALLPRALSFKGIVSDREREREREREKWMGRERLTYIFIEKGTRIILLGIMG